MSGVRNNNHTVVWLGLATCAWLMLFVWQGLDFTDMGFWLTGYQQFYANPDTLYGPCWLSYFIGHWIGLALGGGVLAYKLGYVVVVTTSAIIAYRLLASQLGYRSFLAGLVLLTVVFAARSVEHWIDYNNLTALFYVAGAALLFHGLTKNRLPLVSLAGVVLAANLFVRFPNLLGVSLVAAVWLWAWSCRWSLRKTAITSAIFLAGFVVGVALMGGVIELHGHREFYLQGVAFVFGMAGNASSHHSGGLLVKMLVLDHGMAICFGVGSAALGAWVAYRLSKINLRFVVGIVLCAAIGLALASHYRGSWLVCTVPGFCYTVLGMVVVREARRNPALTLIAFIAGMVLFLAPLGSGNGMQNAVYGMYLALPLSLMLVWKGKGLFWGRAALDNMSGKILVMTIVLALAIHSVHTAWGYTYRDSANRVAMTSLVNHPKLVATYTTEQRAKVVAEVIAALDKYVQPGDELLAYNSIGLIHFITQTKPWLGNAWPMSLQPDELATLIARKEWEAERLPVVVRARVNTCSFDWPSDSPFVTTNSRLSTNRTIFQSFLDRHAYTSVWANDTFEILVAD